MTREIGSEFHKMPYEDGLGLKFPRIGSLVFSGRTAIEAVLQKMPNVKTALLPSYCCDSMIQPFKDAGIKVEFYDVWFDDELHYVIEDSANILVWCDYFGFKNVMPDFDGLIIEDITHSFLSDQVFHERSDYLVASLRKWEPILCGGYCSVEVDNAVPLNDYITLKQTAMALKSEYLSDLDEEKKPRFLTMFSESNDWLSRHYSGLSIDYWSREYLKHADIEKHKAIRRRNAHILYAGLKERVQFLFPEESMDCPLFVPILLPKRDEVRKKLIEEAIYCPVHWPKPTGCESNLYDIELSLICDQRYREDDMERIVTVLKSALN